MDMTLVTMTLRNPKMVIYALLTVIDIQEPFLSSEFFGGVES